MPALKGITRTGGIIDLSIDVDVAAMRSPSIDSMSYKGRTIILTGKGFGSVKGSVTLTKEVVGAVPKSLETKIESWTDDRVCLLLNKDTRGVLKAVLTSAESGKTDTITEMFSLSENIYAKDLPLDSETGEPDVFDAPGDAETSGTLQAAGKKLYYLPATTKVESMPAFRNLYAFDPNKEEWEKKAPLPVWMENISAAAISGILYVKGSPMKVDESGQIPTSANAPQSAVYAYDPAKNKWTECSSKKVSVSASLVGDGNSMYLVGETSTSDPKKGLVRVYDPVTGAGKQMGTLTRPMDLPSAAIHNGTLYVYDAGSYHLESVNLKKRAAAEDLTGLLPDIYEGNSDPALREAVLLAADNGLLIIGPPAADGSSDTWSLKSGTKKIVPGRKRVSDSKIGSLAAAVYKGSVYVIGSSLLEVQNRFFRTDTLSGILTKEPISIDKGRITLSKTSFTYNGKVQKPQILTINGKKLTKGKV